MTTDWINRNLKMTELEEARAILQKWTKKMEVSLTGKRKDQGNSYRNSSPERERELAPIVQRSATFTGNAQNSGKKYLRQEKSLHLNSTQESTPREIYRRPIVSDTWHEQITSWSKISKRFDITDDRYDDFSYLMYLDTSNVYIQDYVSYHLYGKMPKILSRLRAHLNFWKEIGAPQKVLDIIEYGFRIPFERKPPRIIMENNKTALSKEKIVWVESTILEYESFGFVTRVNYVPHCVLPLQVAEHPDKWSLIHDESPLNIYVEKSRFKLEGWEHMFQYCYDSCYGIKFDLKKYYHFEINEEYLYT